MRVVFSPKPLMCFSIVCAISRACNTISIHIPIPISISIHIIAVHNLLQNQSPQTLPTQYNFIPFFDESDNSVTHTYSHTIVNHASPSIRHLYCADHPHLTSHIAITHFHFPSPIQTLQVLSLYKCSTINRSNLCHEDGDGGDGL